jgi:hypothetical protein
MLNQFWIKQDRPALAAPVDGREWKENELRVLADVQAYVDECDLAAVRDDMAWQPEEGLAWFRTLERLQDADTAELASATVGEVKHVQLFRQSREYRGKVVTVRGTARLGYRVVAPRNDLDVPAYHVFWLRPDDDSNSPIAVYALEVPVDFPALTESRQTSLREQVEITGYFFKRLLYRSHNGPSVAPLIVARSIHWLPEPRLPEQRIDHLARRLGSWFSVLIAACTLIIAMAATALAWLATASSRKRVVAEAAAHGTKSVDWTRLPPTMSVEESLRNLSEREKRAR